MTDRTSLDAHLTLSSHYFSYIASDTSSLAFPEIFGNIHVTSYSEEMRGTISGTFVCSSKAYYHGSPEGGGSHVRVFLP